MFALLHPEATCQNLRHMVFPVLLSFSILAVAAAGLPTSIWLRYDHTAVMQGELWRLLTAHLVHLSWSHALMNTAGLALIAVLFMRELPLRAWLLGGVLGALGVSLCLLWLNPQIAWYVGLSGVLHAWLVMGAIADIRSSGRLGWVVISVVIAKLVWEQWIGPLPGSSFTAGGPVIVDAHLYGTVAGMVGGLIESRIHSVRSIAL